MEFLPPSNYSEEKTFFMKPTRIPIYVSLFLLPLLYRCRALSDGSIPTPTMGSTGRVARAAIAQLCSTRNKHSNLRNVAICAAWAKREKASMLFLPECLGFMGDSAEHTLEQADRALSSKDLEPCLDSLHMTSFRRSLATVIESYAKRPDFEISNEAVALNNDDDLEQISIIDELRFIARESGLWISGGGVHTQALSTAFNSVDDGRESKIHNTHIIIDSNGQIKNWYHKIHLFDVCIPGKINLRESKTTAPGTKLVVCDSPVGRLGVTICYDMRFSEMYLDLVQKGGAEVLLVPSAFTVPTGKAHWHALLRARAIENQCYVLAAAQVGKHNEKRESYGHSLAYDPWGEILCDAGGSDGVGTTDGIANGIGAGLPVPSIVLCDIDLDKVAEVRERMPIQQHRSISTFSF
mmetsp:Transcript_10481/g.22399  ORF Transcript_10481/g.22399 Transcript_10481/m.22399 type:complete len:409 (+) Transcript_10481:134-1360(+)|eukprot:CAMPEP_0171347556 /NCGR_PEP_ID=MMETSP0878-20121228/28267_1 /TAXON_ID=67004 /ORGANISM="Thalassiosira weissflogii, Strain CCMP1336" /LENGTH=408 /DNA_ID=CAMNT_0011851637 /DNA_START=86 /DNA_END=1312 /DNA_ORIENTATION=-